MKHKIITFLFLGYIGLFFMMGMVLENEEISKSERRKLASFPQLTLSDSYGEKLEKYVLDHFPMRDDFRGIKAVWNYHVFHKLDNNGIFIKDSYIFQSQYPTDLASIDYFINTIHEISQHFFKGQSCLYDDHSR